jgi:hypothetical protein
MKRLKIFFKLKAQEIRYGLGELIEILGYIVAIVLISIGVTTGGLAIFIGSCFGLTYLHSQISPSSYASMLSMFSEDRDLNNKIVLLGGMELLILAGTAFMIFLIYLFCKWIRSNWKESGEIVNDPDRLKYWER